ncbi:MAG: helix-turn-helix domain-containing protein [Nitrososphaerales archaeon]
MQEIVISSSQPHGWLRIATGKYAAAATILDSKILRRDVVEHLFDIDVDSKLAGSLLADIRSDKDVLDMETSGSRRGRVHGSISTRRCTVCKEIAKSKCFLASVGIDTKEAQWTVMGSDVATRELLASLESVGIPFQIKLKRKLEDRELLTARQEEVLLMAFLKGYFEFPKRAGLRELAAETGVKTSTLTEIIRRGQRKIIEDYFLNRRFSHPHQTR